MAVQRQKNKASKRPTQSDVARLAGVSVPVVSAVLNGSKGTVRVGADVAERVQSIIKKIGYVPNPIARSLVNSRSNIIGVFTFDATFPYQRENFFYPFLQGIEGEIEGSGYDLLLFTATSSSGQQRSVYPNGANRLTLADAAIILGENQNRDELAKLTREKFPFVVLGRRDIPDVELNYVAAAYADTTAEIVDYAWDQGHRRFCYYGRCGENERQLDRIAGFRSALTVRGGDPDLNIRKVDPDENWHQRELDHITDRKFTMVVAEDAEIAELIDKKFVERGVNVPDDISICTLTDPTSEFGRQRQYARLVVPRRQMGAQAVQMLFKLLENASNGRPLTKILACDFVKGTTIVRPAQPE